MCIRTQLGFTMRLVGPLARLKRWLDATDVLEASTYTVRSSDVAKVSNLPQEVAQAFGINSETDSVTRTQALSIPTVSAGRDAIAGIIGTFPLVATAQGGSKPAPRAFLERPDPNTTRQWVITWTVDDLMFYGLAWWLVDERDTQGFPTKAHRVDPHRVFWDLSGNVFVDGQPVHPFDLIRFDGPHEGILRRGAVPIRTALMLEAAARKYAVADQPTGNLRDTRPPDVGNDLTQAEINAVLAAWRTARGQYGTGYLNRSLEYLPVDGISAKELQLVEARQYSSIELARLMSLDANAVNAPAASGMTYVNGVEQRRGRLDGALRQYLEAITARLSAPDVTPRGHVVAFDVAGWLMGDAAERVTTAVAACGGPVLTTDEARAMYLGLPPNSELGTEPAATPEEVSTP